MGSGLIIFAFPALISFAKDRMDVSFRTPVLQIVFLVSLVFLLLGCIIFFIGTNRYGIEAEDFPTPNELKLDDETVQKLLVDYQQVSEEARFYDKYINRTTYLSLAIVGLLATVASQVDDPLYPGIAMVGFFVHFLFTVALQSYKEARGELWDRQVDIETSVEFDGQLAVRRTVRPRENRGFFSKFSFSESSLLMHYLLLLLWMLFYVTSYLNVICGSCLYRGQ